MNEEEAGDVLLEAINLVRTDYLRQNVLYRTNFWT